MRAGLEADRRVAPRVFAVLLMLLVSSVAISQTATASKDRLGGYDPYDPAPERFLTLDVPGKLVVGTSAAIRAEGFGNQGDELTAFVSPRGEECPASAAARPEGAISLVSEDAVEGVFRVTEDYVPGQAGDRSFCAYLGASSDQPDFKQSQTRKVAARRLSESVAERTVKTALRRHDFARRVVKSLKRDCRRGSRNMFACRFSGGFPGYRLKGKGRVELGISLSYRFRVKAQGVRLTLTDDNEESRPK